MKAFIKYMHGDRSIQEVRAILESIGINPLRVELGRIEITESFSLSRYQLMQAVLKDHGFELIIDKETIIAEKIKLLIIEMINDEEFIPVKHSDHLSKKMLMSYPQLAGIFKAVKNITIEQFIINERIERAKQLLLNTTLPLSEIAWKLNYSSPAHLSNQFKKITGVSPSEYRGVNGLLIGE